MVKISYTTLLRDPSFIERMREIWQDLSPKIRKGHPHVHSFLALATPASNGNTALVEADFSRLISSNDRMGRLVERALRVTSNAEPTPVDFTPLKPVRERGLIPVVVIDIRRNDLEVDLVGRVSSMPVILQGKDAESKGRDGLYRFNYPMRGTTVVVYNPAADARLEDMDDEDRNELVAESLFTGRLPAQHALHALLPGEMFPEDVMGSVQLQSRIKVRGSADFDPDDVYAGYEVQMQSAAGWLSMNDLLAIKGAPVKDGSGMKVRIHDSSGPIHTFAVQKVADVLQEMRRIYYSMREVGVVVDPIAAFQVDLQLGAVKIKPGADMVVLDVDRFADEDGIIHGFDIDVDATHFKAEFAPNVTARAHGDQGLAIAAEHILERHSEQSHYLNAYTPETIIHKMLRDQGDAQAIARARQLSEEMVGDIERAALYDYVFERLDRKLSGWAQAEKYTRDPRKMIEQQEQKVRVVTIEAYNAFMRSLSYNLSVDVVREDVDGDVAARAVFERGRELVASAQGDGALGGAWEDMFEYYVRKNGMRQISMFYAKQLPLLAYASSRAGEATFFKRAVDFLDTFDARRETLSWETFAEEAHAIFSPDEGPDGGGGSRPDSTIDERAAPSEPGLAQVLAFPVGGRGGVNSFAGSANLFISSLTAVTSK